MLIDIIISNIPELLHLLRLLNVGKVSCRYMMMSSDMRNTMAGLESPRTHRFCMILKTTNSVNEPLSRTPTVLYLN